MIHTKERPESPVKNMRELDFDHLPRVRLVRRLPANSGGRDFVVGDLHGCLDDLYQLLEEVRFDPARDRLLSVGDLADRGPRSLEALALLRQPWVHGVMGNHEQMLVNAFAPWLASGIAPNPLSLASMILDQNGGGWAFRPGAGNKSPPEVLGRLLPLVADLPLLLVVGEGADRYQVVHAELVHPARFGRSLRLWTDAELDALAEFGGRGEDRPDWRWSRRLMAAERPETLPREAPGLSLTICGHTIGDGVRQRCSHLCVDTGAYVRLRGGGQAAGYGLTVVELPDRRIFSLREGGLQAALLPEAIDPASK
jgi:serine/threonine protein phosphatase 1